MMSDQSWADKEVVASVLPQVGNTVKLLVADVGLQGGRLLLWGSWHSRLRSPGQQQGLYAKLYQDVQAAPGPRVADGGTLQKDDWCLKEVAGQWLRGQVVRRHSLSQDNYWVFLLDTGCTAIAKPKELARGHEAYFRLPAEALVCTVANLIPRESSRWSRSATESLLSLQGQEVSGQVQEVLHPFCVVVLKMPALAAWMQQQGFSKPTTPAAFRSFVCNHLSISSIPQEEEETAPASSASPLDTKDPVKLDDVCPLLDYHYPTLDLNTTKWVLVTEIDGPHRIYCQLRSVSRDIQNLSSAMSQDSEGDRGEDLQQEAFLPTLGSPCAALSKHGHWYRALVLEIYPEGGLEEHTGVVAQVVCVDSGRKEFVSWRNLRHLPAECFSMPVLTYPCALQGVVAKEQKWASSHISKLRSLLLGKALQVHIEAYCTFENVYYVTFLGAEGFKLNCLFGERARWLTQRCVHRHYRHTSDSGAASAPEEDCGDGSNDAFMP